MPVITYDRFEGGLDLRPLPLLSRANILQVLKNAFITTGRSIKKRPCLSKVATLEAGTVGLKASGTKLLTFYGDGAAITHANTLFQATRTPHISNGSAPTKINYCDQFNALPYVVAEYSDGTSRHHFLDDPGTWAAATTYAANSFRRPNAANGFRYEVTAGGGGASGATEPAWPTTVGATVVDNALTWTCRTFAVTDANCPHSKITTKRQQKIYSAQGPNVRYCKTGDCRDWSAASDAGFIPAGLQAPGSDQVTALGQYQKSLAVFFSDAAQVWAVSSDPAQNALTGTVENVGTNFYRSPRALAGDLFFLSQSGYRSMSLVAVTENLQDSDVGNPIDKLVTNATINGEANPYKVDDADDPLSIYFPTLGTWLSINGDVVFAYSFSKTAKLSAWATWTMPFNVDDATVLAGKLYMRSGNDVYMLDTSVFKDGASSIPEVDVLMNYQDGGKPGVLKQFTGIRTMGTGTPTVSFKFAAEDQELESEPYELNAVSVSGQLDPVELCAERIAPHFTHQKDEDFELSLASLIYEALGVV